MWASSTVACSLGAQAANSATTRSGLGGHATPARMLRSGLTHSMTAGLATTTGTGL